MIPRLIKYMPLKTNNKESIQVFYKEMDKNLIGLWMDFVQPIINKNYTHAKKQPCLKRIRADVGWDWFRLYKYAAFHNFLLKYPNNKSGSAYAFALTIRQGGVYFPIGMLTTVPKFYCNVMNKQEFRGFAWYLADAPYEVYEEVLGIPSVSNVAKALVDFSIQLSINQQQDGSFLLHADKAGGDKLLNFYSEKCGMKKIPDTHPKISFWRFSAVGQYFYFDSRQALDFCRKYDERRVARDGMLDVSVSLNKISSLEFPKNDC